MRVTPLLLAATALTFTACSSGGGITGTPMPPLSNTSGKPGAQSPAQSQAANARADAALSSIVVYTLSNESTKNLVEGYSARNGAFERVAPADTRGRGDPSIAGTVQGAIAADADGRFLFAVDAGSNEITSFRIRTNGLFFADKVTSNGKQPVSLTVFGDLLYVLNAGSSDITGFKIDSSGMLKPISGSTEPLSGTDVGPAEISFDPSGQVLVVTEKTTNKIDTYSVANHVPSGPTVHSSAGTTPFGFAFVPSLFVPDAQTLVVSDAFNGASGAGAVSSYGLTPPSTLKIKSDAVPDHNTSPCWLAITPDGKLAFTSNTGSDTISAYAIDHGKLTLTTQNGISAHTDKGPADLALAPSGKFLFVNDLKSHVLGVYAVDANGKLDRLGAAPTLPADALGLAALTTR
jgi:6-phosphogluconolactonase